MTSFMWLLYYGALVLFPPLLLVTNELADKGLCCVGKRIVRESEGYSSARE